MAMAAQSLREMAMARWQLLLSRTPQALIFVVFRTWRAYIDGEKRRRARNRLDEELAKEGERLAEAMEFEAQRQTRQVAAAAAATMRAVEELIEDLILDLEDAAEAEAAARRPRAISRITAYRIAAAKRGIASARSLSTKAPQLPFASVHPGNLSLRSMAQHLVDHGLTTPDLYMVHDKRELHDLARQHGLAHVLQAPPPPPLPLVRSPAIMQQQQHQQQQQQQQPPFGLQTPPMRHPKVPPLMPASPSSSAAIRSSWLAPQTTDPSPVHVASARRHTTTSAPSAWTDDVSVTSFASGVGAQGGSSGSSSDAISGGSPFAIQTLRSSTPFLSGSRSAGKKPSPAAGQARAVTGSGGPRPLPALGMLPRAAASRANISQAAMKLHTIDLSERNATRSKLFLDERAQIKALEYAKELYATFVPGTLSWLDPNNNKAFLDGQISVTGVLSHRAGHAEETTIVLPHDSSGSKHAVQAVGSSTSYGKRYTAGLLLNLTSRGEDDDGDKGGSGDVISDDQADEIRKLIDSTGSKVAPFLTYIGAPSVADIPASKYAAAKAALAKKAAGK
jgi:hypothetical protein